MKIWLMLSKVLHNDCTTAYKIDRHHIKVITTLNLITIYLIYKFVKHLFFFI